MSSSTARHDALALHIQHARFNDFEEGLLMWFDRPVIRPANFLVVECDLGTWDEWIYNEDRLNADIIRCREIIWINSTHCIGVTDLGSVNSPGLYIAHDPDNVIRSSEGYGLSPQPFQVGTYDGVSLP